MKLEEGGKVLEEFIGIRAKCYVLKVSDHEDKVKRQEEECQKKSKEFYDLTKESPCEHEAAIMTFNKKEVSEAHLAFLDLEIKRIKGVARNVVAKEYTSATFRDCIENGTSPEPKMQTTLVKKDHRIWTKESIKQAFTVFDDKRYILPNGIDQIPYGHPSIPYLQGAENPTPTNI